MKNNMFYTLGIDPSLNGFAAVLSKVALQDKKINRTVIRSLIISKDDLAKISWDCVPGGVDVDQIPKKSYCVTPINYDVVRLRKLGVTFIQWLEELLDTINIPEDCFYAAIEGYSMGSRNTNSIFQLGELGGLMKQFLVSIDILLRVYPPKSVKKFCTGSGVASKRLMVYTAGQHEFLVPENSLKRDSKKLKKKIEVDGQEYEKDITGPGCDLCDAFLIGRMLQDEVLLKLGIQDLMLLGKPQYEAMTTTSKTNPVSLLEQAFVGLSGSQDDLAEELNICG